MASYNCQHPAIRLSMNRLTKRAVPPWLGGQPSVALHSGRDRLDRVERNAYRRYRVFVYLRCGEQRGRETRLAAIGLSRCSGV